MSDLEVRIRTLSPMRVASFKAVGKAPEPEALELLRAWTEPKGLFADPENHPVFGFNNPNPTPEREEYGYEFWVRVGSDSPREPGIEFRDFAGGEYAVTRCKLHGDPKGSVPEVWRKLLSWVQSSEWNWRRTHELEKLLDPTAPEGDIELELYLPVER
jgi:AraC family transcriptional regulator